MAQAGTVAVLLPGAFYFLRETKLPPVQALRDAGVPIALATDHNPGSSPGLSLLLMLVSVQRWLGFPERGVMTIWLGHLLLGLAYATVVIQARLQTLNPQLEEAAQDLGARPLQVFWLVTLPMIAQSLASAWLLTFTLSMDDVVLAAFLSGPGSSTLPLVIFSRARLGLDPSINAVATAVIAVVALAVVGGSYAMARVERRRQQDMAQAARHG